jgi:ATP-dependent Clp protease ATP-binding subunit ClpB
MLARGELRMISATTSDEYRKHIEKDAVGATLQPVLIDEPSVEDAISIMRCGSASRCSTASRSRHRPRRCRGAQPSLHHRRFLPDKAIDLVDEACAMLRTEID